MVNHNRKLLTPGANGKLIFWDFLCQAPRVVCGGRSVVPLLPSPAMHLLLFCNRDLVAIGMVDSDMRMINREAQTIVRQLRTDPSLVSSSVTNLAWDPDPNAQIEQPFCDSNNDIELKCNSVGMI